jgi:hypothetical protein
MAERKASLRAADFVDALPIPINGEFTWKECAFTLFDYQKKSGEVVATTTAARVTFEDKNGQEYIQHYSVGDPERVLPSKDGKSLALQGENLNLNKSSNFFILIKALEDSGLDAEFLTDDFSALEGMVTHNIGVPEPSRAGLARPTPAEGGRGPRILAVPDEIITQPGGRKGAAAGKKAAASAANAVSDALGILVELVAAGGKVTRQTVASAAVKAKKGQAAQAAFKLSDEQLAEAGYVVDDEGVITVAD